jgi:hypothetical protein
MGELLLHLLQLVFQLQDPGIIATNPVDAAEVRNVCASTPIVIVLLQTVNVGLQALNPELHPLNVPLEVIVLPQNRRCVQVSLM